MKLNVFVMLYMIMITPDWLLNKVKKIIKHKKVNKSDCINNKNISMLVYHILKVLVMKCLEF